MVLPILDPRLGDLEDDVSSPKQRSMFVIAGSLLAEISLPKLVIIWMLLIGFPGLLLGLAPLLVSAWLTAISTKAAGVLTDIWPALVLVVLLAIGWIGGRRLLRQAETSFWSLNALMVQPMLVVFREGLRHLAESLLPRGMSEARRAMVRSAIAGLSGVAVFLLGLAIAAAAWPYTMWTGRLLDLPPLRELLWIIVANSVVLIAVYFAVAGLVWGVADALMLQPREFRDFSVRGGGRTWRVAHLSDIHTVGERYGFRIESGRAGPRGNERLHQLFARLDAIHAADPLDVVLITGDLTDAGRSAEWAEFLAALAPYPALAERIVALPGNHDVNVVDRASPARMELPTSPTKRMRQLRTLSMLDLLHGGRMRVMGRAPGRIGQTFRDFLAPHADAIVAFADAGSGSMSGLWEASFPMVMPPDAPDGLGIAVLNSNAETHFSFSNALGLISADQTRALRAAMNAYPDACWIVGVHHHVVEYPRRAKALSERIGTALINGSWFVRQLRAFAGRAVIMHGHRHVDWIGTCEGLLIVSAPSPVMESKGDTDTYFYIHTLERGVDGLVALRAPERVTLPGAR
jgi:predicted phosphodiesterase